MPDNFEQKRAARIERMRARAAAKHAQADALHQQGTEMLGVIPFGQPILLGHYSERGDRRYRARATGKIDKAIATANYANELERRAAAAEQNNAIFSDDPAAVEKIEDKIARLEKRQELMKAANRCIRKNDRAGLVALGFSESRIEQLFAPDYCNRVGFADYEIKNNAANICRLKKRAKVLTQRAQDETTETIRRTVRIVDNVEENRLQLFFPEKPAKEVRQALGAHGFRWSHTNDCWQAFRGNNAKYWSQQVIDQFMPEG